MICQYCDHKLTDGKCLNPACPGRLRHLSKDVRALENAYIEQGSILEWIQMILDGKEVSEFALSFPIVQQVWDLRQEVKR